MNWIVLMFYWIFYFFSVEYTDISSSFPPRVLGFSLYVSNSPNRSEGDLCFEDTFYTKETVPMIFSQPCLKHGQYIIFYNERLNGFSYPDEYSADAFSDLCEVEVYGMFSSQHLSYTQAVDITSFLTCFPECGILKTSSNNFKLRIIII